MGKAIISVKLRADTRDPLDPGDPLDRRLRVSQRGSEQGAPLLYNVS